MATQRITALVIEQTRDRWNGTEFVTQETSQLSRLARYPMTALSRRALFACAMMEFPDVRQLGVSKYRVAAE